MVEFWFPFPRCQCHCYAQLTLLTMQRIHRKPSHNGRQARRNRVGLSSSQLRPRCPLTGPQPRPFPVLQAFLTRSDLSNLFSEGRNSLGIRGQAIIATEVFYKQATADYFHRSPFSPNPPCLAEAFCTTKTNKLCLRKTNSNRNLDW